MLIPASNWELHSVPAVSVRAGRGEAHVGREERAGNKLTAQHGPTEPYSRSYGAARMQIHSRFYLLPSLQSLLSVASLHKHRRRGRVLRALSALYFGAMHHSGPISHHCFLLQPACCPFFIPQRILPISPHFGPKGLGASCLGPGVRVTVNDVLINSCIWVALYLTQLKPYLAKETWGHLNQRFSKASQKREGTYLGLGGIHQTTSQPWPSPLGCSVHPCCTAPVVENRKRWEK